MKSVRIGLELVCAAIVVSVLRSLDAPFDYYLWMVGAMTCASVAARWDALAESAAKRGMG